MEEQAGPRPVVAITVGEARRQIEAGAVQIVDIRPPFDFAGGHVPHSLNLPGQALRHQAPRLQRDRPLLVVDADGTGTEEACALAAALGFLAVTTLDGGFEAWLAAGYDIHTISDSMPI